MSMPLIKRDSVDFTSDSEICNIGYYEGKLNDKRPIRCEVWYHYGVEMLTIFISTKDLENDEDKIKKYLVDNKIINIIDDDIYITDVIDSLDNEFYSVNVPLKENDKVLNELLVELKEF